MMISTMTSCRRRHRRPMGLSSLLLVLLALLGCMAMHQVSANEEEEEGHEEYHDEEEEHDEMEFSSGEWQETYWYMAPSKGHGTGWGVFAAKDFAVGDMIDVAPMFVNLEDGGEAPLVTQTVLNHYYSQRWVGADFHSILLFGSSPFYNHGEGLLQNVKLIQLGNEQDGYAYAHYALRNIASGEELLSNHGEGGEKTAWFQEQRQLLAEQEDDQEHAYFYSKIYAGHGIEHCHMLQNSVLEDDANRDYDLQSYIDQRVSPYEAGYRNAMARVDIHEEGTILEIVPALYVQKEMIMDTLLEPIVLFWQDIDEYSIALVPMDPKDRPADNQSLEELWVSSLPSKVQVLVYKSPEAAEEEKTSTSEPRLMEVNREEDTVLLPLGGNLAMMERTSSDDPDDYNCRLEEIAPDRWNSQAVTLRIVSTKPIAAGGRLILQMAGLSASDESRYELYDELVATGQPLTPTPEGMEGDEEDEEEGEYDYDGDIDGEEF